MGLETLVLLFVVFSVISSIVNKVQEYRRRQDMEEKPRPAQPSYEPPVTPSPKREIDLSDWEVLPDLQPPDAKQEQPEAQPPQEAPAAGEFREVRGARRVEEPATGQEFREVTGKRPVTEAYTGEEFREVRGKRPVTESEAPEPAAPQPILTAAPPPGMRKRRHRRRARWCGRIRLGPNALRRAVVYQEILGPPRADHMPW